MPNALTNMLIRMPDVFNKEVDSKITKLLTVIAEEINEFETAMETVKNYRDIDQAIGYTLDKIGVNIQQFRGAATDGVYRILLKSKIARNLSTGAINNIINILSITLNTDYENIKVEPLYNAETPEPAAVFISIPTALLNEIGFSITQFGILVNKIVADGVSAKVLFQGTFAFSSQLEVPEIDPNAGFADVLQTTGGFFGAVYDPANEPELPI